MACPLFSLPRMPNAEDSTGPLLGACYVTLISRGPPFRVSLLTAHGTACSVAGRMSDVVVPVTSPVHLTQIQDIHAVDLHVKYCELVKAYEKLVGERNHDKKAHEKQLQALRDAMSRETTLRARGIQPTFHPGSIPATELELRYAQMEARVKILQSSLEEERKINKDLEADLQTAVEEGIKYRDHLARLLDLREKDAKGQSHMKMQQVQDHEAKRNAMLKASLLEAEKAADCQRGEALKLQREVDELNAKVADLHMEAEGRSHERMSLAAELKSLQSKVGELEVHVIDLETEKASIAHMAQDQVTHIEKLKQEATLREQVLLSGAEQDEKEKQRQVEKLQTEVDGLKIEATELKQNEQSLQRSLEELQQQLEKESVTNADLVKELKLKDNLHQRGLEEVQDQLRVQSEHEIVHKEEMQKLCMQLQEETEGHIIALQCERDNKARAMRELQQEFHETLASKDLEIAALKDKCREYSKLEVQCRAEIQQQQVELVRLKGINEKSKMNLEAVHMEETAQLKRQLDAKQKEIQALQREREDILRAHGDEKEILTRNVCDNNRNIQAFSSELEAMQQSLKVATEREASTKCELRQLQDTVEAERETSMQTARDLQKKNETSAREIQSLKDDVEQFKKREQKMRSETNELQQIRQRLLDEIEELRQLRTRDRDVRSEITHEFERRLDTQDAEIQEWKKKVFDSAKREQSQVQEIELLRKGKEDLQRRIESQNEELNDLQLRINNTRNVHSPAMNRDSLRSSGTHTFQGAAETSSLPDTPEIDPEEWKTAISQYEAATSNTIVDFVLVNKRASTVNVISIDTILRRHLKSVARIDVSYNYLRNSGVISLAYALKTLSNLVHLDIGDNHIGDSGAAAIAEATSASKRLQTLALGGNRISDPGLTAISTSMASSLSTLNFNFNCVADDGATSLANALRAGKGSLTCLYLSGNIVGSAGITELADAVSQHKNLKQMYLRGNPLDTTARSALERVAQHHPSLVIFV